MSGKYSYLQRSHFKISGNGSMGTSTYRSDFSGADIDAAATLNE